MRPIKFRAWDKNNAKWLTVGQIGEGLILNAETARTGIFEIDEWDGRNAHNLDTGIALMQFTGLLDKNGKEIYEGDVVLGISDGDPNDETFPQKYNEEKDEYEPCGKYEVRWMENCAGFNLWDGKGWIESDWNIFSGDPVLEVLGNIYENPSLLEVK